MEVNKLEQSLNRMTRAQADKLRAKELPTDMLGNLLPKAADCLTDQLSFDLVSVSTLEAEVLKLRKSIHEMAKTVSSYQGHYNADQVLIKKLKDLLRESFRVMTPNKCAPVERTERARDKLLSELLQRGLT